MAIENRNALYDECPSCGRRWYVDAYDRGWEGFLRLPVDTHKFLCAERTPEQRRSVNKRDERRWSLHPTHARIINAVRHIGLVPDVEAHLTQRTPDLKRAAGKSKKSTKLSVSSG
jgi:hypothetical protein